MVSLFPFAAFVQFVGAFNFANIFSRVEDKFVKEFLNAKEDYKNLFDKNSDDLILNGHSILEMKYIKDKENKLSNEKIVNNLKDKYRSLKRFIKEYRKKTLLVANKLKPDFSRPLFLTCGLYSTFALICLPFMDATEDNNCIYAYIAFYNLLVLVYMLYFVLCEFIKHVKWLNKLFLFKPTLWSSFVFSLLLPICAFALYIKTIDVSCIVDYIGRDFLLDLTILLPCFGFVFITAITLIYFFLVKTMIRLLFAVAFTRLYFILRQKRSIDKWYDSFDDIEEPQI